jgi:hypothetical protein
MLKKLFKQFSRRPDELKEALRAFSHSDLVGGIADLFSSGELRLGKRKRKSNLCSRFYRYHKANPKVADWFLEAARKMKNEEHRERYAAHALMQKIRWNVKMGVIKTDGFKISNDLNAPYARLVLMRDPSLCGLFALKASAADNLIVDGHSWSDFAKEHHAELWPEKTAQLRTETSGKKQDSMFDTEIPQVGEKYGS